MVKTILIVEDNELNMKLFQDLLQAHGCNTVHSVDGRDTLQLTKKHGPDLILMDIRLPEVSGMDHIKSLKADDDLKDIPVIAVTAYAMKGDKEKILEAGFDGYISKPISVPHFLGEVKKFLTIEPFRLTEALMIGQPRIDAEHEQLKVLLNEFIGFIEAGDDKSCAEKINEITNTVISHFEAEEKVMEELGYWNLESHKEEHLTTITNFHTLINDTERTGYGSNFTNELTALLVNDMIRADMDFKLYLQEISRQVSASSVSTYFQRQPARK